MSAAGADRGRGTGAPLRIAQVGFGRWGANVARDLEATAGAALTHIVDIDPAACRRAAGAHPGAAVALRLADVLGAVDAVAVCTPAGTHAALALAALEAARHVFVEKPMAMDPEGASALVAAAERRGLTLMVGHQLLFHGAFLRLREIVASGELGPLVGIRSERGGLVDPAREPGVLWAYGPHDAAMILELAGRPPLAIAASADPARAEVALELELPGGVRASTRLRGDGASSSRRLVAICARGEVAFADSGAGSCAIRKGAGAWEPAWAGDADARLPLARELAEFVACALTGCAPRNGGDRGLAVTRVLAGAAARLAAAAPARASSFRSSLTLS